MIDGWEVPTGRKLEDSTRPKDWFGSINVSPTADDDRVKLARRYFTEASADDFEIDGKNWIDKQAKTRYRMAGFNPLLSTDPADTGVDTFVIYGDSMLFLRPKGSTGTVKRVEVGSVGAVRVS